MRNNLFSLLFTIPLLFTLSCSKHLGKYSMLDIANNTNRTCPKSLQSLSFLAGSNRSKGNNLLHAFVLSNYDHVHSLPDYTNCSECKEDSKVLSVILGSGLSVNNSDDNTIVGSGINGLNHEGYSPLHLAVLKNSPYMVKLLQDSFDGNTLKVDVNITSNDRDTPLHIAAENGHTEVLKALLEVPEILVNEKNNDGYTPLHAAAYKV